MKIKFGSIITDGRGKIGGHVATKNRGGAVLRTKVTPSNAQSASQGAIRNRFTGLAQAWRGLTQEQRDAWDSAVASYSRTDIFGDLRNPSGANLYQRLNNNRLAIGESALAVPPLPSEVQAVVASALSAAVGTPAMSLTFAPAIDADTKVQVLATAPVSAGKSFVKSEYRRIGTLSLSDTSPKNILSLYVAKFGNTGAIGQKIFVKILPTNLNTGQTGSASVVSVITVA